MNKDKLTKEIAYNKLQKFFVDKPMVIFGTGISCALDGDFGMGALKKHLFSEIPKRRLSEKQKGEWSSVAERLRAYAKNDFESAMDSVQDKCLLNVITDETACFVASLDKKYSYDILSGKEEWPAITLFKRLVDGLPEIDRKLHVATTNYDLLAEYAFEQAGIPYITGFSGGVCRHYDYDWKKSERSVTYVEKIPQGKKLLNKTKLRKHIRLYKVHGSLNTFKLNNQIVENNAWINDPPKDIKHLMITPGASKHEKLHQSRESLLAPYDEALKNHSSFLFIGFGFNDSQLIGDIIQKKLQNQKCPGLIITRDTNERIKEHLEKSDNLWLVCKNQGEKNEGTRIYNNQYADWLYINDAQIWKTNEFVREILGG